MDPITAALFTQGLKLLTTPGGPSAEQLAAQQAAARAAQTRALVIGGALVGGALLVYFVASRR